MISEGAESLARYLLDKPNRCATLRRPRSEEVDVAIAELVDAGIARVGDELVGPLAVRTGEECLSLTPTGITFLTGETP